MNASGSFVSRRRYSMLLVAVLVLLAVGALLLLKGCLSDYEVLEKGQILSYTKGIVYKIRFCHTFTMYIEPEYIEPLDLVDGYLMSGVAFIALTFATIVFVRTGSDSDLRYWFYLTLFLGVSYLAADEMLGIHESIGHNLQFLRALPFVSHPDDMVILSYGVPALAFLVVFRRLIIGDMASRTFFGLAIATFAVAAISDDLNLPVEEYLECLVNVWIIAGTIALGLHHTSELFGPNSGKSGA